MVIECQLSKQMMMPGMYFILKKAYICPLDVQSCIGWLTVYSSVTTAFLLGNKNVQKR